MQDTVIKVGGMSCQGCVSGVTNALRALAGVAEVEVSLAAGEARVRHDPAQTGVAALKAAIEAAGFDAE